MNSVLLSSKNSVIIISSPILYYEQLKSKS